MVTWLLKECNLGNYLENKSLVFLGFFLVLFVFYCGRHSNGVHSYRQK